MIVISKFGNTLQLIILKIDALKMRQGSPFYLLSFIY
jgi:hypothetical protein